MRLLVCSVLPVGFATVLAISLLDVLYAGWTYAVILIMCVAAMVAPYAVGWVRSFIGLVVAGIGVLWILGEVDFEIYGRVLLALALVGADAALVWFSLRFGHVWKPEDATDWHDRGNPNFPYPYF